MANDTAWTAAWAKVGGTGLFDYTPGEKEFTNMGLIITRAYLTYDGVAGEIKVQPATEKSFVEDPSAAKLLSTYSGTNFIQLPTMSKQLPGIDDAPTWTNSTDDPEELVGRTEAGKPEKLSTMEFTCPAAVELQQLLLNHAAHGSVFTLIQCANDGMQANYEYFVTPRCRLLGVGTSSAENNSGGEFTVRFQPHGGIYIPVSVSISRTSSNSGTGT